MKMTIRTTLIVSAMFFLTACGESGAVEISKKEVPAIESTVIENEEVKVSVINDPDVNNLLIDGTSIETVHASIDLIIESRGYQRNGKFTQSLYHIFVDELNKTGVYLEHMTPEDEIIVNEIVAKKLHGKSAQDVEDMAKEILNPIR